MVASIGAVAAPAQGASYYERDGYYAKEDPEHREASAWAGRGAEELGLVGPVDPDTFRAVLEGRVPDGSGRQLGRRTRDGEIHHRPGRDLTFSAPKSVSLAALVGGDVRVIDAHDRAAMHTLEWFEKNVAETRMKDPESGRMVRTGNQKTVIATFRHDASRNLDPALHTHSVIANMLKGADGTWRSMANEKLYASKMLLGAMYRNELARDLARLGYGIEKTHADGRFEIAGVPREIVNGLLDKAGRDRGGDGRAWAGRDGREPAPRPARRAVHPRRQARRRPRRAPGKLGETGRKRRWGSMPARTPPRPCLARPAWKSPGRPSREGRRRGTAARTRCRRGRRGVAKPPPRRWEKPVWRRSHRRPRRRGRSPGRSPISRSAKRCSPAPICWPPRSSGARARRRPRTSYARRRRWRGRGRCTPRVCRASKTRSPPTARSPTRRRRSR